MCYTVLVAFKFCENYHIFEANKYWRNCKKIAANAFHGTGEWGDFCDEDSCENLEVDECPRLFVQGDGDLEVEIIKAGDCPSCIAIAGSGVVKQARHMLSQDLNAFTRIRELVQEKRRRLKEMQEKPPESEDYDIEIAKALRESEVSSLVDLSECMKSRLSESKRLLEVSETRCAIVWEAEALKTAEGFFDVKPQHWFGTPGAIREVQSRTERCTGHGGDAPWSDHPEYFPETHSTYTAYYEV